MVEEVSFIPICKLIILSLKSNMIEAFIEGRYRLGPANGDHGHLFIGKGESTLL